MSVTNKYKITEDLLRTNFERALQLATTKGIRPPSESGLAHPVLQALVEVADNFPDCEKQKALAYKALQQQIVKLKSGGTKF